MGGEQIALNAVCDELEAFARSLLFLPAEASCNPIRETCAVDRSDIYSDSGRRQAAVPRRFLRFAIKCRKDYQCDGIGGQICAIGFQCLGTLGAGFAAGKAQFDKTFFRKKGQAGPGCTELAPVEIAFDRKNRALAIALIPGFCANGVRRFQLQ